MKKSRQIYSYITNSLWIIVTQFVEAVCQEYGTNYKYFMANWSTSFNMWDLGFNMWHVTLITSFLVECSLIYPKIYILLSFTMLTLGFSASLKLQISTGLTEYTSCRITSASFSSLCGWWSMYAHATIPARDHANIPVVSYTKVQR